MRGHTNHRGLGVRPGARGILQQGRSSDRGGAIRQVSKELDGSGMYWLAISLLVIYVLIYLLSLK